MRMYPTGRFPWIPLSYPRRLWVRTLPACPVTDHEPTKASGRASAIGELSRMLQEDPDASVLQSVGVPQSSLLSRLFGEAGLCTVQCVPRRLLHWWSPCFSDAVQ